MTGFSNNSNQHADVKSTFRHESVELFLFHGRDPAM